jgi:DNA primase
VRTLSRYSKNIVALFDGDEAGQKAAARSFEIFVEAGLLGRAAFLPQGDDPDTFVRRRGKAAVEAALDQAVPLAEFYFKWLAERHGATLEGKSRIANEISRVLSKVGNPFEADLLIGRAVDMLGIREELLRRQTAVPSGRSVPSRNQMVATVSNPDSRDDKAQRSLVSLMLRLPSVIAEVARDEDARQGFGPKWHAAVDGIVAEWQERGNIDVSHLAQEWPPELAGELAALAFEGEHLADAECVRMAADCLAHLRRRHFKAQGRILRMAIRAAEEQRDEKAKRERILEWQDLVRKERQLERPKLELKTTVR